MIIISQNLTNYDFPIPKDAIFRINLAWISDLDTLEEILEKHKEHKIFLDLPKNRTKPPNNKYSMTELEPIIKKFDNIKYFAISNVNSSDDIKTFKKFMSDSVIMVPKIESPQGVENIDEIVKSLGAKKIIMLDHDDLFSSIIKSKKPVSTFKKYISKLIIFCKKNKITLLRTVGVVFSDDEFRTTQYIK